MTTETTTPTTTAVALGAAWAEAEAALPEGWAILSLRSFDVVRPARIAWFAAADAPGLVGRPWHERHVRAHGSTPAEAMLALAAALRDVAVR